MYVIVHVCGVCVCVCVCVCVRVSVCLCVYDEGPILTWAILNNFPVRLCTTMLKLACMSFYDRVFPVVLL